jgi:hypothetical protein
VGNMSEVFIKSRWIPFICQSEEIKEEPPNMCLWNTTIVVLMLYVSCPNATSMEVDKLTDKRSVSQ